MITDFVVEPVNGTFDVATIERRLAETPFAVRDENVPNEFMLADDLSSARRAIVERRSSPQRFPYYVALVLLNPSHIEIGYRLQGVSTLRAFVAWLSSTFSVRYLSESQEDFTHSVDPEFNFLFGTGT